MIQRLRDFSFTDLNLRMLGGVTIGVVVIVIVGVYAFGRAKPFQHQYEMSGVFTDSGGLKKGDTVRLAGVDVGAVNGVRPDFDSGTVIITWSIKKGVDLGPDMNAAVQLSTLLGGKYLRLSGTVRKPFVASLPASRRRIPIGMTSVPTPLSAVLNNSTRTLEQLDTASINDLLARLGDLATDNASSVPALLQDLTAVASAVNERESQVRQLVSSSQQITATLASKDQALAQLVDSANTVLDVINERRDQLAVLLGSGSDVVSRLTNLITQERQSLDGLLQNLHSVIQTTAERVPDLNRLIPIFYRSFFDFSKAFQQGPWFDALADGLGPVQLQPLLDVLKAIR